MFVISILYEFLALVLHLSLTVCCILHDFVIIKLFVALNGP